MIRYDELAAAHKDGAFNANADIAEYMDRYVMPAKVVRISKKFANLVLQNPAPCPKGFDVLKPVYSALFCEMEGGVTVDYRYPKSIESASVRVDSFLIVCGELEDGPDKPDGVHFVLHICGFGPYSSYIDGVFFGENGDMVLLDSDKPLWSGIGGVARNILDLLASPSVVIERPPDVDRINHARKRKGKEPLTEWHVVNWSDTSGVSTAAGDGARHRVRYDVRGNWATFRVGKLAGMRIWRRAHQRGLANETFRPKGYVR